MHATVLKLAVERLELAPAMGAMGAAAPVTIPPAVPTDSTDQKI